MKRGVIILFLVGILLISPLVQAQTYSGWDKFTDSIKLFFSSGDNKVKVALEIKEKEVTSAIENVQNGDEEKAEKNLEGAWKKLQLVQEKVSINTAKEVKQSSNEVRTNIMEKENLPKDFEVYALEEEKTGLTAEWVIEVNGKEGQTLEREVVIDVDNGQNRIMEIENRIDEIDNEISNWVVENDIAEGDNGLTRVVKTEIVKGDNGLKPEVKTYVAGDGTQKDGPLPEPDLNKVNPDLYDPNARAPGDTIDETYGDDEITNNIDGGTGTEGTNEIGPAVDSNEGDGESSVGDSGRDSEEGASSGSGSDSGITGEIIEDSKSNNLIKRILDWLF